MPLPMFSWQSSKPLLSHNFVVFVGVMPIPFSKVSSIEVAIETEALAEGGENRFVHSLSKPMTAEKTLVLERGADSGLVGSVMMTAANTALRVGSVYRHVVICVLDQWGLPKKMYAANHAILKKRRFSDLNAMSGEVFVESLELVYRDMTEVPGVSALFGAVEAGKSLIPSASPAPERFTPPRDTPPEINLPRNRFMGPKK